MKKILLVALAALSLTFGAQARDTYSRDIDVLPEAAKTTIKNNFKSDVSVIKVDKSLGRISEYEVTLTDGTEVKFDNKGNWKDIETAIKNSVPNAFVPEAIRQYVKKNQPGTKVIGIEQERSGYEVSLDNGIDIKFDKSGSFLRYD